MNTQQAINKGQNLQNIMDAISEFKYLHEKNESEAYANATVDLGEEHGITVRCEDLSYDRIMSLYCHVLFDEWNND